MTVSCFLAGGPAPKPAAVQAHHAMPSRARLFHFSTYTISIPTDVEVAIPIKSVPSDKLMALVIATATADGPWRSTALRPHQLQTVRDASGIFQCRRNTSAFYSSTFGPDGVIRTEETRPCINRPAAACWPSRSAPESPCPNLPGSSFQIAVVVMAALRLA